MRLVSLLLVSLCLPGCVPCDFPVRCVDSCATQREVSNNCGSCPAGSVRLSSCIDAGAPGDASIPPD